MSIFNVDITFKTPEPITQDDGKQLGGMATHFRAIGASTYRFQAFEAGTDLETVMAAAVQYIRDTLTAAHPDWTVEFQDVGVETNEAATRLAQQRPRATGM